MAKKKEPRTAIIVESPTKTRTLKRFLGDEFDIVATRGHVRDLPERKLSVDIEGGFEPTYEVIPRQQKNLAQLAKHVKSAETVYLACDPDREGEAIAWHVAEVLGLAPDRRARIEFNEITARAVRAALQSPRPIDGDRVNAQQARRILDRIVGYQLSPLLQQRLGGWRGGARALSAGRVQSAALRLVVERERERAAFVPVEGWQVRATLTPADRKEPFQARVLRRDDAKLEVGDSAEAQRVVGELREAAYAVADVSKREVKQRPQPPFRTSTLQRAASTRFGYSATRTMAIAQELYEGVELGEETAGLITYMRTDSTRIAAEAREAAVAHIESAFGEEYVGPGARGKAAKGAQDAHEAIRPTDVTRTPEAVAQYLSAEQLKLYRLIWQRFLASQMAPAVYDETALEISAGRYGLRASAKILRFPGWRAVYGAEAAEDDSVDPTATDGDNGNGKGGKGGASDGGEDEAGEGEKSKGNGNGNGEQVSDWLPDVAPGDPLELVDVLATQHFSQAPARFNQGSLIAELERYGIGRPSTYAPIVETLRQRRYVDMQGRSFVATPLGVAVYDFLMEYFPRIMDLEFTARMEDRLDSVESGEEDWVTVLREFYDQFAQWLQEAETAEAHVLDETCPKCGGQLVEKFSRYGRFASCENYPECKYTRDIGWNIDRKCPKSGHPLQVVLRRDGTLTMACSSPDCDWEPAPERPTYKCSECGKTMRPAVLTDGRLVLMCASDECTRTYGPAVEGGVCPKCGQPVAVELSSAGVPVATCTNDACDFVAETELPEGAVAASAEGEGGEEASGEPPKCPECGADMVQRRSRRGPFWGCSRYPECKGIKPLAGQERPKRAPAVKTELPCPKCSKPLVVRHGRRGPFLGCSGYPRCRFTRDLTDEEKERYLQPAEEGGGDKAAAGEEGGTDGGK